MKVISKDKPIAQLACDIINHAEIPKVKVLIVEDLAKGIDILKNALMEVFPKHLPVFTEQNIDLATSYEDAKKLIKRQYYDVVLLDHNMPRKEPVVAIPQDTREYFSQCEDIGYTLIPMIREENPAGIVIIGTTSYSPEHVKDFPQPDASIMKKQGYAAKQLEAVMEDLMNQQM